MNQSIDVKIYNRVLELRYIGNFTQLTNFSNFLNDILDGVGERYVQGLQAQDKARKQG